MNYNKTKRTIEKVAGILGTIASSIGIVVFLVLFIQNLQLISLYDGYYSYSYEVYEALVSPLRLYIAVYFLFLVLYSSCLSLCINIIKKPIDEKGNIIDRKVLRIFVIILAFLTGQASIAVLEIVVMCLSDYEVQPNQGISTISEEIDNVQNVQQHLKNDSLDYKVAKLKELKELGVIDEAQYKKAVEKIIDNV